METKLKERHHCQLKLQWSSVGGGRIHLEQQLLKEPSSRFHSQQVPLSARPGHCMYLHYHTSFLLDSPNKHGKILQNQKTKVCYCLIQWPNSLNRASLETDTKSQSTAIQATKYGWIWPSPPLEGSTV